MSCNVPQLSTPPGVAATASSLVVVDQFGATGLLLNPAPGALLGFNGTEWYGIDGSDSKPFVMPSLKVILGTSNVQGVLVKNSGGRVFSLVNETEDAKVLQSVGGNVFFGDLPDAVDPYPDNLPNGILKKRTVDGITTYSWLGDNGLVYINSVGDAVRITNGAAGTVLQMTGGTPSFASLPAGNVASGTASIDLSGVYAGSVSVSSVNIKAPVFGLTNGSDSLTVANVNVTVALTNPVGLLGLDAGGEESDKWYYYYITSDGINISAIISLNSTAPNLSGTTHTYYGLAGVFRNNSAGDIRTFTQKGRRFTTPPIVWGNNVSVTTSLNNISSGTALGTILPPSVKACSGIVGGSPDAAAARSMIIAASTTGIGMQFIGSREGIAEMEGFKYDTGNFYDLPILDPSAPVISWRANSNDNKRKISIIGYTV